MKEQFDEGEHENEDETEIEKKRLSMFSRMKPGVRRKVARKVEIIKEKTFAMKAEVKSEFAENDFV